MHINMDKFKDECGVFGIFDGKKELSDAAFVTYGGLFSLQHRGQESAGIASVSEDGMKHHKDMGLVSEVFKEDRLKGLGGYGAIGHVRYSTAGDSTKMNAQPLIGQFKLGEIATAHNGNLVNAEILRELLEDSGHIFQTTIDSEVILKIIARGAKKGIINSIVDTMEAVKGSYGMVFLTQDFLIGVRDPNGIRPLSLGRVGDSYMISSESCAFTAVGGELIRDVEPGEIVIIDKDGIRSIKRGEGAKKRVCAFEYIYFARPDSIMDGIEINSARIEAGRRLFMESPVDGDVVIPVPDSGIPAALGYSKESGIPYVNGFVKNRYIGRTFIAPSQKQRENAVSLKLSPIESCVKGKRVILIDDSIVRGTTSRKIINQLRRAGALEVHLRIASPMVKHGCYFGIDTPYRKELIASGKEVDEINDEVEGDSTAYLSIDGLVESLGGKDDFCLGCFNGNYPLNPPVKNLEEE